MIRIDAISPGSLAERLGLAVGDQIVSINGSAINDAIDYQFLATEDRISLAVITLSGKQRKISIDKLPDDSLGIEFPPLAITRCRNRCIFCFVDQMPPRCRKSLYVKDDDYRASFLYGNYITLGALTEQDWQRIFHQRLSPLYISVHATDHGLRSFMLGNKKAPDIMESIKRLAAGGIRMHTQIVLCPGVNDGEHLRKTVEDLSSLFPAVLSIAVVPVGATAFRKNLFPIRAFTRAEARTVVKSMREQGVLFKKRFGTRLIFVSDELYIKAALPFPPASYYEDCPQRENGVGMVPEFLRNAARVRMPARIAPIQCTAVTSVSFGPVLKGLLKKVNAVQKVPVTPVIVTNRFFGASVTVAGLLTGSDILQALRGRRLGTVVTIPASALNEEGDMFLDDMPRAELEQALGTKIVVVDQFRDLIDVVRDRTRRNNAFR